MLLVAVALVPLFWDQRYYFRGDARVAYFGWWLNWGTGSEGPCALLDPSTWEAGTNVPRVSGDC